MAERSWFAEEIDIESVKSKLKREFDGEEPSLRSLLELKPAFPYFHTRGMDTYVCDPNGRLFVVLHDKPLSKRRVTMTDPHGLALINARHHAPPLKRAGKGWGESKIFDNG